MPAAFETKRGELRQTPSARKFLTRLSNFALIVGAAAAAVAGLAFDTGRIGLVTDRVYLGGGGKTRGKTLCASYTKKGPGRKHRSGDVRAPLNLDGMSDEQRYVAGYMHAGERSRYLASTNDAVRA